MIIKTIKVSQLVSPRTGRAVANQLEVRTPEGIYFQSYDSVISFVSKIGEVMLDEEYWNYSRTTSKYRNEFLGESTEETKQKIADGIYKLVNLN